ncbi:histidine kinase [Viridibacillus arvi]|uniref:Histidine kinase n=1 Tax=Viridibacillus arvi TaxID=263475 RepID=A0A0M0LH83_9BACL|nr:histidine kinase [Viridibacillus arvi]KOO50053.1 histidine kinase [Viridibacillus arvi]
MKHLRGRMDESILVCAYYGANGERLIRRGHKMAKMLDCPLYILTVDPQPFDNFDAEKVEYLNNWQQLAEELEVEEFIIRDNEKKPIQNVIAEIAHQYNITQVVIGQTAQSRWEEITKGSFMNLLLKTISFVDLHVVSVERHVRNEEDAMFEKGVRAYLLEDGNDYKVSFTCSKNIYYEGIFFKEVGTDFDNGIFKFMHDNKMHEVHISENHVTDSTKIPSKSRQ